MVNSTLILGAIGSLSIIVLLIELLRRRHLRGKYAILWISVAVCALILTCFPQLLFVAADVTGVEVPSNLLFFAALILLLLASIQHSYEVGRLEERTRVLAEEVSMLKMETAHPDATRDTR